MSFMNYSSFVLSFLFLFFVSETTMAQEATSSEETVATEGAATPCADLRGSYVCPGSTVYHNFSQMDHTGIHVYGISEVVYDGEHRAKAPDLYTADGQIRDGATTTCNENTLRILRTDEKYDSIAFITEYALTEDKRGLHFNISMVVTAQDGSVEYPLGSTICPPLEDMLGEDTRGSEI